jgi:hypothetical protein
MAVEVVSHKRQNWVMTKGFKLTEEEAVQFMLENGIKPLESFKSALSLWECECLTCGENIITKYSRIQQGGGCAFCAGKKVNLVEANLIMAKANLEPLEEYSKASAKWKCRCLVCKRIVYPAYGNIKSGQNGCSFCTGQSVDVEEALQKMKLANLSPLTGYTKGKDKWKSKCLICQRIVFPTYNQIQQGSGGCKYCSKRYIEKSEVVQFMLERRLKPLEEYSKASAKWLCECLVCGSKISVEYSNVSKSTSKQCSEGERTTIRYSYLISIFNYF